MDRTSLIAELNSRGLRDEAMTGPLYKRLAQALTGLIQEGLLKAGAALPGERDLAEALQVGRVTVRTAYRDLLASGAIESRHGSGTFVSATRRAYRTIALAPFLLLRRYAFARPRTGGKDPVTHRQHARPGRILPARSRPG